MSQNGLTMINIKNHHPIKINQLIYKYLMRVKLKLLKYDGDEKQSVVWINKAGECFEIHNFYFK